VNGATVIDNGKLTTAARNVLTPTTRALVINDQLARPGEIRRHHQR
jgi:hypothetical protein